MEIDGNSVIIDLNMSMEEILEFEEFVRPRVEYIEKIEIDENGTLIELFEKPVIINKYIPDSGLIAFIADLSRGYIFARPNTADSELLIGSDSTTEGVDVGALKVRIGGQILQPATSSPYTP